MPGTNDEFTKCYPSYGAVMEKNAALRTSPSMEYVLPPLDCDGRKASLKSAVFSLVNTIIGGGVLSLPYTFSKTGCIYGPILVIFLAMTSDFTAYLLISASRRSGGTTIEQVALRAFGPKVQYFTIFLLFLVLIMTLIAYITLLRDLSTPLVEFVLGCKFQFWGRSVITLISVVIISPACFMRTLHSLRFISATSIFSVLILSIAIAYRSVQSMYMEDTEPLLIIALANPQGKINWTTNWNDLIYALPIISISFLCHFNVLNVHMELVDPTRTRLRCIMHTVMMICTILYITIGMFGYLFARSFTQGNILNNFYSGDIIISIGRLALVLVIMVSYPIIVFPCRLSLVRIFILIKKIWHGKVETRTELLAKTPQSPCNHVSCRTGNILAHLSPPNLCTSDSNICKNNLNSDTEVRIPDNLPQEVPEYVYSICTILIIMITTGLGVTIENVAIIWNFMGSYVSIFIAYILPAAFYLKIRAKKGLTRRFLGAWCVLIGSVSMMILCFITSVFHYFY